MPRAPTPRSGDPVPGFRRKPFVLLMFLAVAILTACATARDGQAPGCQGPRRPANPHGSVLIPRVSPAPAAPSPRPPPPAPRPVRPPGGCGAGR